MLPKNDSKPISEPSDISQPYTESRLTSETFSHKEFTIMENKIKYKSFMRKLKEIPKQENRGEVQAKIEESKTISSSLTCSENAPPELLAWCPYDSNIINIVEIEKQQSYASFEGVKIINMDQSYTHVKEIPNTKLLVSLHHDYSRAANLEIFDISKKDRITKIYSFEQVSGITGYGDVTYNARRSILGAIPVTGKIAYHLYHIGTSKADAIVKLNRKSRWYSQYSTQEENFIVGLDFNPPGELVATFDRYGVCLISDVNNNSYSFHTDMEMNDLRDGSGHCRWSTNTGEPLLFVKYDGNKLNVLDVEKKALVHKHSILTEENGKWTFWIDVCQNNGNLLATGGLECNVKIFDKREWKIVNTFDIHDNDIFCVRWSPNGDTLATASFDDTAKLVDFKTGKVLYTGNSPDGSKF